MITDWFYSFYLKYVIFKKKKQKAKNSCFPC